MSSESTPLHLDKEPKPIQWSEGGEKGKAEAVEAEERGQKAVGETFEKIRSMLSRAIGRISNAAEHFKSAGDFTAASSDTSINAFSRIYRVPNRAAEWFGDENAHLSDIISPKYTALKAKAVDGIEAIAARYSKAVDELSNRFSGIDVWSQSMHESLGLSGAKKAEIESVPETSAPEILPSEEVTNEESLAESAIVPEVSQSSAWKPISLGEGLARFLKDESTGPRVDAQQLPESLTPETKQEFPAAQDYKAPNQQEMRAKIADIQAQVESLLELDTSKDPDATKEKMEKIDQLRMVTGYYEKLLDRNVALSSSLNENLAADQETNGGVV